MRRAGVPCARGAARRLSSSYGAMHASGTVA